jgi:hypothetical protein
MRPTKDELSAALENLGSMRAVGKKYDVHHDTVGRWLDKCDLPRPSKSLSSHRVKGKSEKIPQRIHSALDGLIAGDGFVQAQNQHTAFLGVGAATRALPDAVKTLLSNVGLSAYEHKPRSNSFRVTSANTPEWRSWYERWYPNGGKKRLPTDIPNEAPFWRWLHAGDGSLAKVSTYGYVVNLHVCNFTLSGLRHLKQMLAAHGIEAVIHGSNDGKRNRRLYIGTHHSEAFIELTAPSPHPGLQYRWEIETADQRECQYCGETFTPRRSDMVFCSRKCGVRANHPFYQEG